MDAKALRSFELFAKLDDVQLRTVHRHTRALDLPAQRWLLRSGRHLNGSYFLAQGRVRRWPGGDALTHRHHDARARLYPGATALYSLSSIRLLQVDLESIAFLLADASRLELCEQPNEPWLQRWLESPLLQRIEQVRWQQLLQRLEPVPVRAGQTVVRQGQPGTHFYVLREGQAQVRRGAEVLACLAPGDVFGEDALLSGAPRNASVVMQSNGVVMRLPRAPFLELLVHGVVKHTSATAARLPVECLNVGQYPEVGKRSIPLGQLRQRRNELSCDVHYLVTGAPTPVCVFGTFLLLQFGLEASVLESPSAAVE